MDLGSLGNVSNGSGAYASGGKAPNQKLASGEKFSAVLDRATKLAGVKERMRTGYYKSEKVDEAISDKISGVFDKLA